MLSRDSVRPVGRISWPHVAPPSRLISAVRPSARIQCPCKANGGPGTAVNYPLYTALALEPIFNDLSNLAGGEKRERERRRRMMGHVSPRLALPRSAENSRGPRRSRDDVNDDGENGIEDEEATRDGPGDFPRII